MGFAVEKLPSKELADLVARELRVALDARLAELGLDPERADFAPADAGLSRQNALALEQACALLSPGGGVMERVDVALRLRALHRLSGLVESTRIRNLEPQFPARRAGPLPQDASRVRLSCKLFRGLVRGHLASPQTAIPLSQPIRPAPWQGRCAYWRMLRPLASMILAPATAKCAASSISPGARARWTSSTRARGLCPLDCLAFQKCRSGEALSSGVQGAEPLA